MSLVPEGLLDQARDEGAARERRRIRAKQARYINRLRIPGIVTADWIVQIIAGLDAATSAPRKGRCR